MKRCVTCQQPEERRMINGKDSTNISPISGQCLDCLMRGSRAKPMASEPTVEPRDPKKAAAHDVE